MDEIHFGTNAISRGSLHPMNLPGKLRRESYYRSRLHF